MTKQLQIIVYCMCILGVMLIFKGVFICNICGKNWLFTEIKHVLFSEISVFLRYIFLHKL